MITLMFILVFGGVATFIEWLISSSWVLAAIIGAFEGLALLDLAVVKAITKPFRKKKKVEKSNQEKKKNPEKES